MKKIIEINGMSCDHCKGRVEKALNALEGVEAKVELKKKRAIVDLKNDMDNEILKKAVEDLDFKVLGITEKKGLFGK